jgi:hypothetical protein
MEIHLTATFTNMSDLEQAAEDLRRQGVLDIRFDDSVLKVDYQADTFIQSLEDNVSDTDYGLQVSVEKSRYRHAEDIITRYGGTL